jgi:hypothetical protein
MPDFFIGLDLGQAQDYTALAIAEKVQPQQEQVDEWSGRVTQVDAGKPLYHVRHLQRWQLGTSYPAIVKDVVALSERLRVGKARHAPDLVVDQTGVGRPVVDMLRGAGLHPKPVTITGGTDVTGSESSGFGVPKRDLVGTLQVLLQAQRLKFAEGMAEVPTLVKELLAFQVKITASAHDTYGAWREGTHDDQVLAVAMAVWFAERKGEHRSFVINYWGRR